MSMLPPGLLLTFYGDDFTGSSAVMEVMAFAGLKTVLFLGIPTPEQRARFQDCRVIGIAGTARAQTPDWMDAYLPPIYDVLASFKAPLVHYKVCSTFDSAPQIGSIGKAIDLGVERFPGRAVPVVVGAPAMARYQMFGTLFAGVNGMVHRLDRHPVMARHPVTPMQDADLTRHLARQTARRITLIDGPALTSGQGKVRLDALAGPDDPVMFMDVFDAQTLCETGALVWKHRADCPFVAGSQGVEYALVAHWRASGWLHAHAQAPVCPPVPQIAVVSGSCSLITGQQIDHAEGQGFCLIRLDAALCADERAWDEAIRAASAAALEAIGQGNSPLVYTARGPDDPAIAALNAASIRSSLALNVLNARIGAGLGKILAHVLRQSGLRRAVIAGGDTSGAAIAALGLFALEAIAAITPGAPLCVAFSEETPFDGLQIALKGGQMGGVDFFSAMRHGSAIEGRAPCR